MRLILLFLLLGCASCEKLHPAEALLDDYLTRLARVLDTNKPELVYRPLPRLPPLSTLKQNVEPLRIDLLDYWAFRDCGLTLILSERNSVLGRVMLPSQLLHIDGRILRQLAHCEQQLQEPELKVLTQQLLEQKRRQWPARYWNATIAAPELRKLWSTATTPLIPGEEASFTPADSAMQELIALPEKLRGDEDWPDIKELENHYQHLEGYALGGKLLHSLQLAHDYLFTANNLIVVARTERVLCPGGKPRAELNHARNVMQKYFIGEVQPWFAAINQRASLLLPAYHQLVVQQDTRLQPLIEPYRQKVDGLYADFLQQNRIHVAHWQALFDECGSSAVSTIRSANSSK